MGITTQAAGAMRENIQFQTQVTVATSGNDGYGNAAIPTTGAWQVLVPACVARISPTKGTETEMANRQQGIAFYDVWVRYPSAKLVGVGDRIMNNRPQPDGTFKYYNIRWISNPDERKRFLHMVVEEGVGP